VFKRNRTPNRATHRLASVSLPRISIESVDFTSQPYVESINTLRSSGAAFALVFGSQARGTSTANSDIDVAAWWPPEIQLNAWELTMPGGVDLVDLSKAPLELAGRIACEGVLLFDDNPEARVYWVANTRKIWLDEKYRFELSHRTFLEAAANG
jgi:uncharacterized protein